MSSCRLTLCGKWQLLLLVVLPPLHSCVSSWVLLPLWLLLLLVARAVTVLNELSAPCCGATVFNVHSPQIRFADRAQRHSARCPSTSLSLIRIAALCKAKHRQQAAYVVSACQMLPNAPAPCLHSDRPSPPPPTFLLCPTQITELILLLYMKLKVRRSCGA